MTAREDAMPITDELRDQLWRKAAIVLRQHFNLNVAEATSNLVDAIIPIIAAREASARREGDEVAQKLRAAAEAVCWFDWSSNDPEADRGERIPDNWAEVLHYNGEVLVGCFYATHWRPRQSPPASAPNPGPSDDDGTQEVVT
jgi:hypothetical protein